MSSEVETHEQLIEKAYELMCEEVFSGESVKVKDVLRRVIRVAAENRVGRIAVETKIDNMELKIDAFDDVVAHRLEEVLELPRHLRNGVE